MVFGEIIEPSSRAFLDTDNEEYKELKWKSDFEVPKSIETLLITETPFANKVLEMSCLSGEKPLNETFNKEISMYSILSDVCVVMCRNFNDVSMGEIMQSIIPLVKNSKHIYALTTASTAAFHDGNAEKTLPNSIQILTNSSEKSYPFLETPNLVTGIGANVLSYCVHVNQPCTLFVGYLDYGPIDSLNSKPFIDLLNNINIKCVRAVKLQEKLPSHNLYM